MLRFLLLLLLLLPTSVGFAQHQHPTNAPGPAPFDPKRSSFPEVTVELPFSRPLAARQVKPTGKRVEYDLVIDEKEVNISGKPTKGLTLNGAIPGPTLRFTEGDVAVIRVHNKLDTEASIHWHGILLPNEQDGVSYLNTPPIEAHSTHTFEYPLVQPGTYWFHSHTGYQEQLGVYGSMVIQPQKITHRADAELVLVLSDWTNENPAYILKNLKRRNEWYSIRKGTAQSLDRILKNRALGAYFRQSLQRMPPMDLSDVYYERFLINGRDTTRYPEFKPGQTVRLRVINAGASTYFHLNFAGGPMRLIAADGLDVQPVEVDRRLIAIAETYDFLVTIPTTGGAFEVRATAQDGSGYASAWLGTGRPVAAPAIPRPNLFALTKSMNSMGMGSMALGKLKLNGPDTTSQGVRLARNLGELAPPSGAMAGMNHGQMPMPGAGQPAPKADKPAPPPRRETNGSDAHQGHTMPGMKADKAPTPATTGQHEGHGTPKPEAKPSLHQGHDMSGMQTPPAQAAGHDMAAPARASSEPMQGMNHAGHGAGPGMGGMSMMDEYNTIDYGILRSPLPTTLPADRPVREVPLILSGNMYRYIWGFNGRTLSRADMIQIRRGEIVRFRFINQTMMLHPLHLHGHYFRVLNGQGEYSPLKHTVNVMPMETVVIEFLADEEKDWFFHCHLLYHMLSGMARVVSYGDKPDSALAKIQHLHTRDMRDNQPFVWGFLQVGYPLNYYSFTMSNNRNALVSGGDHDWRTNSFEIDLDYERYLSDWLRVFAGVDAGNEEFLRRVRSEGDPQNAPDGTRRILRPVAGIRYVLPLMIDSEIKVDTRGNVRFQLSGQQPLFPRLELQFQGQWLIGGYTRAHLNLQYIVTKNLFIHTDYDTRYRTAGAGLGYNF